MAYLCCPSCSLRLPPAAAEALACPSCGGPLERTSARGALGYQLIEIFDPLPLSPSAAAVAMALESLRPPHE
jgi:hypothetical protein